jgi:tRNA-dihydrouridine synthase 3
MSQVEMSFLHLLPGSVVMGPMTKGSNLPYRRLCVELGARVTLSEMALARRLRQKRRSEFALIRRAPGEPCFGVQLAGNRPEEIGWAAALAEERGADFVDLNLGCPIDRFTRIGLGASLARQPGRVRRLVQAMKTAVRAVPVTAKFRLGWNDEHLNYLDVARAAVDGGADALVVHGRTRDARYRRAADWEAIGEVAAAVPVPVVGNGDILFPRDAEEARRRSGCAALMVARGALVKPWVFREMSRGSTKTSPPASAWPSTGVTWRSRSSTGATTSGDGRRWPSSPAGTWASGAATRRGARTGRGPGMQEREPGGFGRTPLEALLARDDEAAHAWLVERWLRGEEVDPAAAPPRDPDTRVSEDGEVEG